MLRATSFVILLLFTYISISAQQLNKADVDFQVAKLKEQGLFLQASGLLVKSGIYFEEHGDTISALHFQLENCNLIDEHLEYFRQKGLTPKIYYSNWYITVTLMACLGKSEAVPYFVTMLESMSEEAPDMLPFYSSELSYLFDQCKDVNYRDSVYILQKALNVIKSQSPTPELVKQYVEISSSFNWNRFVNSFNDVQIITNRLKEIQDWYKTNSQYIHNLNCDDYSEEIIEYETGYTNMLYSFAGTIAAQKNEPFNAISLYEEIKSVLSPLLRLDIKLSQKIAACDAKISQEYCCLGDFVKSKDYNDLALKGIVNHENNFEYCDVLNAIALNSFALNNSTLAAQLKSTEISLREELGWKSSQSEWGLYFMYLLNDDPQMVLQLKDIAIKAERRYSEDYSIYMYIGEAYSKLMYESSFYKDSAEFYFHKAENIIISNYSYYNKIGHVNDAKSNINAKWAAHYARTGEYSKSYNISKDFLIGKDGLPFYNYCDVIVMATLLHDIEGVHKYFPKYYYGLEDNLINMLPKLGSLESDIYLKNGESNLYHIPEWASWNPEDTVSISIAYDAALLMKGLTLRYETLASYMADSPSLVSAKHKLEKLQDSIYSISNKEHRFLALYKLKLMEKNIFKELNIKKASIHWQDIKKQLKGDEVCIEFVKYTTNTYTWSKGIPTAHYVAIVLSGTKTHPIFIDLFDEKELYETYTLQPKSYDTEAGLSLYEKIWGKLNDHIANMNCVYFSPMGMLNLINIEALADRNGKTALEKYNLKRVSSTRQLVSSTKGQQIESVVSFGGIDYTNMPETIIDSLNTRGNWNYLKNTLTELNNLETSLRNKNIRITTITGSNATESSFKKLDGTTTNLIHIASHGFYIPIQRHKDIPYYSKSDYTHIIEDELFYSGLIMSGGQSAWKDSTFVADKDDGILTSYEISKLDLHKVSLVVLSACETGLGDNLYDGIFGLQRAFKKAGVESILMSLWNINDKATSEYMGFFYSFLSSGLSKQASYRRAVAEMRKKYDDPYYWASFILLD